MENLAVVAVLCLICIANVIGQGDDELLLCKPARSLWKSSCPNTSSVATPGKQGPKGERGSDGLRGPVGPPGVQNRSEIERQNRNIQSLTDLVMGMISRQYHVDTTARTWSVARAYCKSIGADLATHGLRNPIIRNYILDNLIRPLGRLHNYWIGLTDFDQEGTWVWIDGVAATTENTFFRSGAPEGSGDCAQLYGTIHMLDEAACDAHKGVVCEWRCPCGGN